MAWRMRNARTLTARLCRTAGRVVNLVMPCTVAALFSAAATAGTVPAAGMQARTRGELSAIVSIRDEANGEILQRSRINLTRDGIRVHLQGDGSGIEFLHDFRDHQVWLIDHALEQYHLISLRDSSEQTSVDAAWLGIDPQHLVVQSPCFDSTGVLRGTDRWQGAPVEIWECHSGDGESGIQLYSPGWGVVVRSQFANGMVMELTDIRQPMTPAGIVPPPSSYRSVAIDELVNGIRELPVFGDDDEQMQFESDHVRVVREDTKPE